MEKRFQIVKLERAVVDEIVRSEAQVLFEFGCAWLYHDGSRCFCDIECRCTETRQYVGKRREQEITTFMCTTHGIEWAKRTGAVGADKIYPTLALQP